MIYLIERRYENVHMEKVVTKVLKDNSRIVFFHGVDIITLDD